MFFGLDGALLTATSVRSSLSVERVSGSVEDSSEDSATTRGEGARVSFYFAYSIFVSLRSLFSRGSTLLFPVKTTG